MKIEKSFSGQRSPCAPRHLFAIVAVLVAITGSCAMAASYYQATEIGLGGIWGEGAAINASGQVTGTSELANGKSDAFLYSNGVTKDLGYVGSLHDSFGFGINASGQVTGATGELAYIYSNGAMTTLPTLGIETVGQAINASGEVAGWSILPNYEDHAFLYDGSMKDLGTLGGTLSRAEGINESGEVTGYSYDSNSHWHAFLYVNGVMHDLGTLGGSVSEGRAINALGQITGAAAISNGDQHVSLYSNGTMYDLGVDGLGEGINNRGDIVGIAFIASGRIAPFVYTDGVISDLNSMLLPGSNIRLTDAAGINDNGQIVATGYDALGHQSAFLLNPVAPLPSSALAGMALFGLLGVSRLRRRWVKSSHRI